MALLDKDQRKLLFGVGIGVVALGAIRSITPAFRGVGRPLAKATIKGGLMLMDKGREKAAHLGEVLEDLIVEARAELGEEARQANGSEPPTAGTGENHSIQ